MNTFWFAFLFEVVSFSNIQWPIARVLMSAPERNTFGVQNFFIYCFIIIIFFILLILSLIQKRTSKLCCCRKLACEQAHL